MFRFIVHSTCFFQAIHVGQNVLRLLGGYTFFKLTCGQTPYLQILPFTFEPEQLKALDNRL